MAQQSRISDIPERTEPAQAPPPPDKKHRHRWIWAAALVLLVAVGIAIARKTTQTSRQTSAGPAPAPVQIHTATARKGDINVYVNALGTVTPVYTVSVTSRVTGAIMNVHYREGQTVHINDLLLEIDPRPFQAALTQTEGQLAHDQASLQEAQIDLDRYQSAYQRNAIAKQQLDDQEQVVHQFQGTVENDQGQVENAKLNLAYCRITSPIDGRVGLRLVDPGNIVQANGTTPLLVITQLQPITVIFSVSEDYLPEIQDAFRNRKRMEVIAFDRAQQKKLATGYLLTLDNEIDPTTGTLKLRAQFSNQDDALFPNQFVNASLLVDTQRGVTLLPSAAIQRNTQGAYVYLVKPDQTVAMRFIRVGTTENDKAAVTGVNPGDVVAADNFDKLQDGTKVEVSTASQGSTPAQNNNQGGGP
jgi:membrane fusion protein, multidrug efflux system